MQKTTKISRKEMSEIKARIGKTIQELEARGNFSHEEAEHHRRVLLY
jgi:hypothetical protein